MFRIKSPQDVGAAVVFVGLGLAGVGTYLVLRHSARLDWSEVPFMPPWLSVGLVLFAAITFVTFTLLVWRRASQE